MTLESRSVDIAVPLSEAKFLTAADSPPSPPNTSCSLTRQNGSIAERWTSRNYALIRGSAWVVRRGAVPAPCSFPKRRFSGAIQAILHFRVTSIFFTAAQAEATLCGHLNIRE